MIRSARSVRGIASTLASPNPPHPTCSFSSTAHLSSYKPSFRNPRATKPKSKSKKRIPNWKAEERSLRSELSSLERRLNILDKREKSDLIEKDLPPLDEASLDEIHRALMLPAPANPQEARLATHALKRRIARANLEARNLLALENSTANQQADTERVVIDQPYPQSLPSFSESDLPPPSELSQDEIDFSPPSTSHLSRSQLIALRLNNFSERLQSISDLSSIGIGTSEEGRLASEVEGKRREISQRLKALIQSKKQSQIEELVEGEEFADAVGNLEEEKPNQAADSAQDQRVVNDLRRMDRDNAKLEADGQFTTAFARTSHTHSALKQSSESNTALETSQAILDHLNSLISSDTPPVSKGREVEGSEDEERESLPLGLATPQEWIALAVSFAQYADDENLSRTLNLMEQSGYRPNLELFNDVMDSYAEQGDVMRCEETLGYMKTIGLTPSDHTVHSLVKSHIRSNQVTPALNLLSKLEDAATPASIATYTLVMNSLLRNPSLPIQSLSWNLFYHMRLSAHPVPDVPAYAMMIRACANGVPQPNEIEDLTSDDKPELRLPDAERALDLFKEMKDRYGLRPNVEVYNALILTCSKRKDYLEEAWRLFREMCMLEEERISADQQKREASMSRSEEGRDALEQDQDPIYLRYSPDRYTYNALMAGCAREKDLHRARWLLAEMLRATSILYDGGAKLNLQLGLLDEESLLDIMDKRPDEETISWIYKCYASFKAPLKRSEMKLKEQQEGTMKSKIEIEGTEGPESETQNRSSLSIASSQEVPIESSSNVAEVASQPSIESQDISPSSFSQAADDAVAAFTYSVPQTSADVIKEVQGLMAGIVADQSTSSEEISEEASKFGKGPLSNVKITSQVINSFLAVHSQHLPHSQRLEWHAENVGIDLSLPNQFDNAAPSTSTFLSGSESDLFTQFNVPRTGHTHLLSLELASTASIKEPINRSSVEILSFEAFKSFRFLEQLAEDQRWNGRLRKHWGVDTQTIREVWSARIRALTKLGRLRDALNTLQKFTKKYPPPTNADSKEIAFKPIRKSKVKPPAALVMGALTPSPTSISALQAFEDSTIPSNAALLKFETPYLTFKDLELLYHRLTVLDRKVVRSWVQWVIHAYASRGEARKERYRLEREAQKEKDSLEARQRESEEIQKKERKERKAERRAMKMGQASGDQVQLRIINTSENVDEEPAAHDRLVEDVDLEEGLTSLSSTDLQDDVEGSEACDPSSSGRVSHRPLVSRSFRSSVVPDSPSLSVENTSEARVL